MVILPVDKRTDTVVAKMVVKHDSDVVFPLPKVDIRVVAVLVIVLELVTVAIVQRGVYVSIER